MGGPQRCCPGASAGGRPRSLALGLSDWDWGADGLVLHIVAIGIPLTMAVAVTLDLLARPGSLATGERAGLVVAPRPLRAVQRRVSVARRYRELVRHRCDERVSARSSMRTPARNARRCPKACGCGACSKRPAGYT